MNPPPDSSPFTVAYLGGSITWGSGASDPASTSWRARTTRWLKQALPGACVQEVNAAVGGTGSDFALCRLERDVLCRQPRLVFVEFAVNDCAMDGEVRRSSFEGILRALGRSKAPPLVVVVLAAKAPLTPSEQLALKHSQEDHAAIAAHYGALVVDAGAYMLELGAADGVAAEDLLPDGVHPSDEGYARMAEAVEGALQELDLEAAPAPCCPAPLFEHCLMGSSIACCAPGDACLPVTALPSSVIPWAWTLAPGGPSLIAESCGQWLGLAWWTASDSGAIHWRVDGGPWRTTPCWDEYALHFDRASCVFLARDLAPGPHVLEARAAEEPVPGSLGQTVKVGAVLSAWR